jgi:hypothetical protein
MNVHQTTIPWLDARAIENWRAFPPDELAKYAGLYVAYTLDGTRIVASAADEQALDQRLQAAGIDPSQVIHGYVDPT